MGNWTLVKRISLVTFGLSSKNNKHWTVRKMEFTEQMHLSEPQGFSTKHLFGLDVRWKLKIYTTDDLLKRVSIRPCNSIVCLSRVLTDSKFKFPEWTWDWMRKNQCTFIPTTCIHNKKTWRLKSETYRRVVYPSTSSLGLLRPAFLCRCTEMASWWRKVLTSDSLSCAPQKMSWINTEKKN